MNGVFIIVVFLLLMGGLTPVLPASESVRGVLRSPQIQTDAAGTQLTFVKIESGDEVSIALAQDGSFEAKLPPGKYRVYLEREGQRSFLREVEVPLSEIEELELVQTEDERPLDAIRDYEVGIVTSQQDQQSSIIDVVNPFPARRTGRFYGTLYEFHRNDNLDARNFFDPVGEPLPEYKRNQFGVTIGATILPQWSLQGSFDGLRIIKGSTLLSHVPTSAMKQGDFSQLDEQLVDPVSGMPFPGNQIPADRFNPVALRMLSAIPDPNRSDLDRNFVNNLPHVRDQNAFKLRNDYKVSRDTRIVGNYERTVGNQALVHNFPSFGSSLESDSTYGSISLDQSITDRFLIDSRVVFSRSTRFRLSENAGRRGLFESLGIPGLSIGDVLEEGYPTISLSGYQSFGDGSSPNTAVSNYFTWDNSFTYALEQHSLRGGFQIGSRHVNDRRSDSLRRGRFVFNGNYSGDAFADFLLGYPENAYRSIGRERVDLRQMRYETFLQDRWKIRPNLDLTYGFHYEYREPYRSVRDEVSGFYPLLFEPPLDGQILVSGENLHNYPGLEDLGQGTLVFPDRNNIAPRLGLAFNPFGSNRLVVRASYNIYYNHPDDSYFANSLSHNFPFFYVESVEGSAVAPEISLSEPFSSGTVPELTIRGIEPHLKAGYNQYWNLRVQNQLSSNWSLELRYQGSKGTNRTRTIPGNVPRPGPGPIQERRPNPALGKFQIATDGASFVGHEFEISGERRLAGGFAFESGFEWNRSFDDMFGGDPSNPRNLSQERAPSGWIPTKRLYLNYILDMPFGDGGLILNDLSGWARHLVEGWRLSGITSIRDGTPFTVFVSGDPNNDGIYGDRPDRIASGYLDPSERSIDGWFDTGAFQAASPDSFGTAGRNILKSPGFQMWDVSVIKQTRVRDGDTVEFRVELFNAFNHVNFSRPEREFGTSVFGKIFGAAHAREIEIAVKYSF